MHGNSNIYLKNVPLTCYENVGSFTEGGFIHTVYVKCWGEFLTPQEGKHVCKHFFFRYRTPPPPSLPPEFYPLIFICADTYRALCIHFKCKVNRLFTNAFLYACPTIRNRPGKFYLCLMSRTHSESLPKHCRCNPYG